MAQAQALQATPSITEAQKTAQTTVDSFRNLVLTGYEIHAREFLETYHRNENRPEFIDAFRRAFSSNSLLSTLRESYASTVLANLPPDERRVLPEEFCKAISATYAAAKGADAKKALEALPYGQEFVKLVVENSRTLGVKQEVARMAEALGKVAAKGSTEAAQTINSIWETNRGNRYFTEELVSSISSNTGTERFVSKYLSYKKQSPQEFNPAEFANAALDIHREFANYGQEANIERLHGAYGQELVSAIRAGMAVVKVEKKYTKGEGSSKLDHADDNFNKIEAFLLRGWKDDEGKPINLLNKKFNAVKKDESGEERMAAVTPADVIADWRAQVLEFRKKLAGASTQAQIDEINQKAEAFVFQTPDADSVFIAVRDAVRAIEKIDIFYRGKKPYSRTITESWINRMEVSIENFKQLASTYSTGSMAWVYPAVMAHYREAREGIKSTPIDEMANAVRSLKGIQAFVRTTLDSLGGPDQMQQAAKRQADLLNQADVSLSTEQTSSLRNSLEQSIRGLSSNPYYGSEYRNFVRSQVARVEEAIKGISESIAIEGVSARLPPEFQERLAIQFYSSWHESLTSVQGWRSLPVALNKIAGDSEFNNFKIGFETEASLRGTIQYDLTSPNATTASQASQRAVTATIDIATVAEDYKRLSLETQYAIYQLFKSPYGSMANADNTAFLKFAVIVESVKGIPGAYAPLLLQKIGGEAIKYDPHTLRLILGVIAGYSQGFAATGSYRELDNYYLQLPSKLNKIHTDIFTVKNALKEDPRDIRIRMPHENPEYAQLYSPALQITIQVPKHVYSLLTSSGRLPAVIQETSAPDITTQAGPQPGSPEVERRFFVEPVISARINAPMPFITTLFNFDKLYLLAPDYIPEVGEWIALNGDMNYARNQATVTSPSGRTDQGFVMARANVNVLGEGKAGSVTFDINRNWANAEPAQDVRSLAVRVDDVIERQKMVFDAGMLSPADREALKRLYFPTVQGDLTMEQVDEGLGRFINDYKQQSYIEGKSETKGKWVGQVTLSNIPVFETELDREATPKEMLSRDMASLRGECEDAIRNNDSSRVAYGLRVVSTIARVVERVKSRPASSYDDEKKIYQKFGDNIVELKNLEARLQNSYDSSKGIGTKAREYAFGKGRNSLNFDGFIEKSDSRFDRIRAALNITAPGGADTAVFFEKTFESETAVEGGIRGLVGRVANRQLTSADQFDESDREMLRKIYHPTVPKENYGAMLAGEDFQKLQGEIRGKSKAEVDGKISQWAKNIGNMEDLFRYRAIVFKRFADGSFVLGDVLSLTNGEAQAIYQTIKPEGKLAYRAYTQGHLVAGPTEFDLENSVVFAGEQTLTAPEKQGIGAAWQHRRFGHYGLMEFTRGGRASTGAGLFNPENRSFAVGKLFVSNIDEKEILTTQGRTEKKRGYFIQGTWVRADRLRLDAFAGLQDNSLFAGTLYDQLGSKHYWGAGFLAVKDIKDMQNQDTIGGRAYFVDRNLIDLAVVSGLARTLPKAQQMPAGMSQQEKEFALENFGAAGRYGLGLLHITAGAGLQRDDWRGLFVDATLYANSGILGLNSFSAMGIAGEKMRVPMRDASGMPTQGNVPFAVGGVRITGGGLVRSAEAYYPPVGELKLSLGKVDLVGGAGNIPRISSGAWGGARLRLQSATIFGVYSQGTEPTPRLLTEESPDMVSKEAMLATHIRLVPEHSTQFTHYIIGSVSGIHQEVLDKWGKQYDIQLGWLGNSRFSNIATTVGYQKWENSQRIRDNLTLNLNYDDVRGTYKLGLPWLNTLGMQGSLFIGKETEKAVLPGSNLTERLFLQFNLNLRGTF